ncbi:MAG: hypothetical protein VX550_02855 [Bacteroidota bacterium]|uniref:hypothetical protein n=1 Tax=Nonlabens tegetincola TaxID=323273 RepID=UPI002E87A91A|nr:hypothetical protein [Bacteroidota bacterium]
MKAKLYITLIILIVSNSIVMAQPGFDDTVEDVAFIPGIALAIAAALGIGIRKIMKKK